MNDGSIVGTRHEQKAPPVGREGVPGSLGQHLDELKQAVPGDAGMSEEGPGAAAEAAFMERAYPADTISVRKVDSSKQTFRQVLKTTRQTAARQRVADDWDNVGPSRALYPFTRFRNNT
ncbi:MAG: hypothetical protein M3529_02045, partial [Actinomycetota bacterium]|nr:hypothetical protein [Actinomycetota bacterium]